MATLLDDRPDQEQDTGANPADAYYDQALNPLSKSLHNAEASAANEEAGATAGRAGAAGQEAGGGGGSWANNVGKKAADKTAEKLAKTGGVKGKAAAAAYKYGSNLAGPFVGVILAAIVVAILFFGTFMSLPMQLTQLLTNDLHDAAEAIQERGTRMYAGKFFGRGTVAGTIKTKGVCGEKINLRCKFATISERQKKRLEAAGFKVDTDDVGKVRKRYKLNGISKTIAVTEGGKTVQHTYEARSPQDVVKLFRSGNPHDVGIRNSLRNAYNNRVASFFGNTMKKAAKRVGVRNFHRWNLNKDDKVENQKELNKSIGAEEDAGIRDKDGKLVNEESTKHPFKKRVETIKGKFREAQGRAKDSSGKLNGMRDSFTNGVKGLFFLQAIAQVCPLSDSVHTVIQTVNSDRFKTLAPYASNFLTAGSRIQSGEATEKDFTMVGALLSSGNSPTNAGDSVGVKLANEGDVPKLTEREEAFMLKPKTITDFTNIFGKVEDWLNKILGFAMEKATGMDAASAGRMAFRAICIGVEKSGINDPQTQAALMLASVGSCVAESATGVGIAVCAGQIVFGYALSELGTRYAEHEVEKLITKATALPLNAGTTDADAGNAIFAGASGILSAKSSGYGMRPATVDDLKQYQAYRNDIRNQYLAADIADARKTPWDINNRYAFLGALAYQFRGLMWSKKPSFLARVTSTLSVHSVASSLAVPQAHAAFSQAYADFKPNRYKKCDDYNLTKTVGIDPDVGCGVRHALHKEDVERDMNEVLDFMIDKQYIDEETGEPKNKGKEATVAGVRYGNYLKYCANREVPLGDWAESSGHINPLIDQIRQEERGSGFTGWYKDTMRKVLNGSFSPFGIGKLNEIIQYLDVEHVAEIEWYTGRACAHGVPNMSPAEAKKELSYFNTYTLSKAVDDDINAEESEDDDDSSSGSGSQGGGQSTGQFGWPVEAQSGTLSSCYGLRPNFDGRNHYALDIATGSTGTNILAVDGGEVIATEHNSSPPYSGFGRTVVIKHADNLYTRYSHLSAINVKVGDKVNKGQAIAKEGGSGGSGSAVDGAYAVHLDIGVSRDPIVSNTEKTMNPLRFMEIPPGFNNNLGCSKDYHGEAASKDAPLNQFKEQE